MTERPNVPVLKTGVGLPTVGSNPTPSAEVSTSHCTNAPTTTLPAMSAGSVVVNEWIS